jgi:hypothetical protein
MLYMPRGHIIDYIKTQMFGLDMFTEWQVIVCPKNYMSGYWYLHNYEDQKLDGGGDEYK